MRPCPQCGRGLGATQEGTVITFSCAACGYSIQKIRAAKGSR